MNKVDELLTRAGSNITQSMGGDGVQQAVDQVNQPPTAEPVDGPAGGRTRDLQSGVLELTRITPDTRNPRGHPESYHDEELQRLSQSIAKEGLLQALLVRWDESLGKYVIVAGHRRYFACRMAGIPRVPVRFVQDLNGPEILKYQILENELREQLSPIALAKAYKRLQEVHDWNVSQLAEELHTKPPEVSKALKLLDLPEAIQAKVDQALIPQSTAYHIARLDDPAEQQRLAARAEAGMSREDVAAAVQQHKGRRDHALNKTSHRVTCRLEHGVVTLSHPDPITWDTYMQVLDQLRTQARNARKKGLPIEDLPGYLKEKEKAKSQAARRADDNEPASVDPGDQGTDGLA